MAIKHTDITGWVMKEHGVPKSKWTVLELVSEERIVDKNGRSRYKRYYKCRCECGTERAVEEKLLKKGKSSSCGCGRHGERLEGKKFGRLTVLKYLGFKKIKEDDKYSQSMYLCRCECGKEVEVASKYLKSGNTRSCGCSAIDTSREVGKRNHKPNKYDLSGEYGIGYCSNTGKPFYFDLEDYEKIEPFSWREQYGPGGRYSRVAATIYPGKVERSMAQVITGENFLDHINRNTMDNRKNNLRKATRRENNINISPRVDNKIGITGVNYENYCQRWVAHITLPSESGGRGKLKTRRFKNKEDAIKCRLQMEHDYYGEFAPQKHLFAQYGIEDIEEEKK